MFMFMIILFSIAFADIKKIAILEFNGIGLDPVLVSTITGDCRGGFRDGLSVAEYNILTKENTEQVLLDNGVDLSMCTAECEITLGRQLQVDYIVSGTITKIEGTYILTVKVHETDTGNLLHQARIQDTSAVQLSQKTNERSKEIAENYLSSSSVSLEKTTPITFETNVPGITVLWSNGVICKTDSSQKCTGSAPIGKHEFQFLHEKYIPIKKRITIQENKKETISVELKPRFAVVTVQPFPANLNVMLDGKPVSSVVNKEFNPGVYEITGGNNCYLQQGFRIDVKATEQPYVFDLTPETRKTGIDLEAYDEQHNAVEADVYIDGRIMGKTPLQRAIDLCSRVGSNEREILIQYQGKQKIVRNKFSENNISTLVLQLE